MLSQTRPEPASRSVPSLEAAEQWLQRHWAVTGAAFVIAGLLLRLYVAQLYYLNPDESQHYLVAYRETHGWAEWYRNALQLAHPPLLIGVLQVILRFGRSELLLRIIPIAAGSLFPWFVMVWMRRFAGNTAGVCALLILTFSPALIDLGSEVRAYTLALLFVSVSLILLENALERRSALYMGWFHFFLYLAILAEDSAALFVLAAGIYAIACLWKNRVPLRVWVAWGVGQALALALCGFLYATQLSRMTAGGAADDAVNGWLRAEFLQPGDHIATFAIRGTLRQFSYLLGSRPAAIAGAAAFLLGLYWLWKRKPLRTVLIVLPFGVACAGAMLHLFPYGASRHTILLAIFAAVGIGQAAAVLFRKRMVPLLFAALVLIPVWNVRVTDLPMTIPDYRHRLSQMREAVRFLRTQVPPGSLVVTDTGTDYMLAYYLQPQEYAFVPATPYRVRRSGGLQFLVFHQFEFTGDEQVRTALSKIRGDFGWQGPIWVVAGGFVIGVTNPAASAEPFQQAVAIFENRDPTASVMRSAR